MITLLTCISYWSLMKRIQVMRTTRTSHLKLLIPGWKGQKCQRAILIEGLSGFLPASPKAKAGLRVGSLSPSVRPKILSSQLLWNYWSNYHETWFVDGTLYVVMHIGRKFWSPHFCGSYAPWNLEKTPLKLLIRFSWNLVCR